MLAGRYQVLDEIGHGGMGVVYRARDQQLGRDIALKLVDASKDPNETLSARLLREAQALAQLSHPNVVAVYDVGRIEGGVFVAMELISGVAGDNWLKEARPWREVLRVFIDAARGLAAAHAVGLVHRDFKPANLIIGSDGRVRVLDFGLARTASMAQGSGDFLVNESDEFAAERSSQRSLSGSQRTSGSHRSMSLLDVHLTQVGSVVGTPAYMAPEQHLGNGSDARSDQFSFCVSLYRALYGSRPFEGKVYSELKANIVNGNIKPPPAESDVPAWVREVVLRGLAVEADQRWPTMDALIVELSNDPAVRRRKLALAAGAFVLVAGAGVGMWSMRTDPAAACRVAERDLAGVWDGARKEAVRTTFMKTGKPYAADAMSAVTRTLDAYTTRWTGMRTEACLATRVRGTQSAELLDLRMECLQRRLDEVHALVDVFASADAEVVSRAAEAAGRLPPLDTCADADALRSPVRPPTDPKVAASVADAQRALAGVYASWVAGRYAEASKQLAPVLTQAHVLAWRPLEGEAVLMQARLADDDGDYQSAVKLYKDAALAAEAGRDDETAARARNGIVWVTGARLGHYAEAHELARDATAKIERISHHDLLQAELDQRVSSMFLDEGKYKEAEQRSRHALEIRQKILPPDDPSIAAALGDVADVVSQNAQYAEAITLYQRALAVAERAVGPDHSMCASLHINMGTALRYQGKAADALVQFERAREIVERSLGKDHPQLATVAIDTGTAQLDLGHLSEAAEQFRRAIDIWTRALGADHPNVGTAHFRLGEVALKQGHPAEAATSFQRAFDIWQARLGADHPSLGTALAGLGQAATADHQPAKALDYYKRALALLEKALGPDHPELAGTLVDIGKSELELGKPKLAVPPLERAVALREKGEDAVETARARFALARALGTGERAHSLATAAQSAFEAAGAEHVHDRDEVVRWLEQR